MTASLPGDPPSPADSPLPNPPPGPGDSLVSEVVSGPAAMRRSLLVWGWGQVAAGDRRGLFLPPLQLLALATLAVLAPQAMGVGGTWVFLAGALVLAAWALVAVHAWRRAARRRALLGGGPGGGAGGLLWLTPFAVVLGAGFWIAGSGGSDPGLALEAYLGDWRSGRLEAAAARLSDPPAPDALRDAWLRQETALRNALLRVVAEEPTAQADPERLLQGLRWVDLGATPSGGRAFAVEVARRETAREQLFGLLPATAQRLVTVERLGTAELAPVSTRLGPGPLGVVTAWRVVELEIAGERIRPGA